MTSPLLTERDHWYRHAEAALSKRDYQLAHRLCMKILQIAPHSANAMFLLGMIAAEHGNFAKACEVLERAVQLDPLQARCHAQLGRCLIALQRPQEAVAAARRALHLAPADALTLDTIGVVLSHAGEHEQALAAFELAVARAPEVAAYQYNFGTSLQFSGKLAAAERALRSALQLDAGLYRAWTALAQVTQGPFAAEDAEHLQQALERATDADAQLHLCHALAKHYEDLQLYSQAFELWQRGKRAKRRTLEYSFAVDAELFTVAQQARHSIGSGEGHASMEPIFIVGMPRSGSTLLERILATHPRVFAAGELTNFALVVKRATRTASNRVLDAATLAAASSLDFAQLGADYIASTRPRTGHTPRFIDKMPLNFFFAGIIRAALPRARIICVRRNALDTCLANYRQLFASNFPYYHYAHDLLDLGRYYLHFDALVNHWRSTLGPHYCEVWYESLIEDTADSTRKVLEFCGLPWDAACLEFNRSERAVATPSAVQVRQPIYHSALRRWRHYERELAPLRELLTTHSNLRLDA